MPASDKPLIDVVLVFVPGLLCVCMCRRSCFKCGCIQLGRAAAAVGAPGSALGSICGAAHHPQGVQGGSNAAAAAGGCAVGSWLRLPLSDSVGSGVRAVPTLTVGDMVAASHRVSVHGSVSCRNLLARLALPVELVNHQATLCAATRPQCYPPPFTALPAAWFTVS
jgi:hypothetical protein